MSEDLRCLAEGLRDSPRVAGVNCFNLTQGMFMRFIGFGKLFMSLLELLSKCCNLLIDLTLHCN